MRILLFLILLLCLSLEGSQTSIRFFGGYNHVRLGPHPLTKAKVRSGHILGGSVSYQLTQLVTAEIDAAYRHNEIEHVKTEGIVGRIKIPVRGKFESFSIFTNVLFEIPLGYFLQPYVGGGWGCTSEYSDWVLALIDNNIWYDLEEGRRTGISYQLIAGLHLPAYDRAYCGVEYRHVDAVLDHMCCSNHSVVMSYRKEF